MKKYLFVFLILLLLTGCNVQNSHSHTQCPECGKCIAEDCDGAEELKCSGHEHHIYKLTIIDEDSFIYDKPAETSCESDTKIVMHSRPIIDGDLAMYINGEFHSIQNTIIVNDEYVWEYSFIMPERDTTIEFKTQALEYFNVKTILDIPSLTREDILRITVNSVNLSNTPKPNPIPGSLRVVFSSTDYEDITYMLGFLNANVVEDRSDNWQDDTGSCNKYSIYTIDKKYDFEIINGYITVNNKHYKLLGYGPSMSYVMITCAFNTNLDSYEAYTLDGTKIGDFNGLSEFEFYEIKAPLTGVDNYGYLETEFGRIYIHDSKTFYIKDGENYTYYKLVWEWEKDFSDIFNKHKHNECEECGKCIVEDCDGAEEERCQGHKVSSEPIKISEIFNFNIMLDFVERELLEFKKITYEEYITGDIIKTIKIIDNIEELNAFRSFLSTNVYKVEKDDLINIENSNVYRKYAIEVSYKPQNACFYYTTEEIEIYDNYIFHNGEYYIIEDSVPVFSSNNEEIIMFKIDSKCYAVLDNNSNKYSTYDRLDKLMFKKVGSTQELNDVYNIENWKYYIITGIGEIKIIDSELFIFKDFIYKIVSNDRFVFKNEIIIPKIDKLEINNNNQDLINNLFLSKEENKQNSYYSMSPQWLEDDYGYSLILEENNGPNKLLYLIKDNKIMWEYDWIYNLQQICIADVNEDGYFEIYFLHSIDGNGSIRTEFYCYNTYNHTNTGMGWTSDKLEFKCENDKLFIGDKLVSKTYVEPSEGYRDVFFLQSDTYMLIADIGYEDINSKSTLFVETLALYTGETIVVDHSEKFTRGEHFFGPSAHIYNDDGEDIYINLINSDYPPMHTCKPGQITNDFEQVQILFKDSDKIKKGTYDLTFVFNGVEVIIEDYITIE